MSSRYKLVIVVRKDLKMRGGRVAAQVGHAAVNAYRRCRVDNPLVAEGWLDEGGFKIVLKVKSGAALNSIGLRALKAKLPVTVVHDFKVRTGETVTATCLAIGPALSEALDQVTGRLPLL